MKKIMVIMKKDLRETFRTKAFYASIGIVIFVTVMLGWGIGGGINTLVEERNSSAIQALIGTTAFMLSLMLMMLFCIYINAYTLTMEKIKRSIESLLCTPLSLKQICLGKTLALFLPSVILGWLFTFGSIAGINQFFIIPELGQFIMPGAAPLVAILVVVPLVVFFLSLLVIALQLIISNIRWVNAALMGAIFAVGFGLSPVLRFGPSSWSIVLVSLGIAAILALITFLLSPRVTKERIILSSKG
jgi:ABC-2 type transport system permease protein